MGRTKKSWREAMYGGQKVLTLKSRLFLLLRDELGLGQQPKVAQLLADEIIEVVEETLVETEHMKPGQVLLLAPEVGEGPSWRVRKLEEKKLKAVRLTLVSSSDVERFSAGDRPAAVRLDRMVRMVKEAYQQGATLTCAQLAVMTGIAVGTVSNYLRDHTARTGEVLPMRGIVEDCSPAISHKVQIVRRHLAGETTSEIAKATDHTPRSVERYVRRFEQVRELVCYLNQPPNPVVLSRILDCSPRLVQTYLNLIPAEEPPPDMAE